MLYVYTHTYTHYSINHKAKNLPVLEAFERKRNVDSREDVRSGNRSIYLIE